jgi:heat shock protein HslJ
MHCNGSSSSRPLIIDCCSLADLNGTNWQLVNFNLDQEPAAAETEITLSIDDGQISGSAGCNSYNSRFMSGEEGLPQSIVIGPIAATQMLCSDPAATLEMTYLDRLAQVASWRYDFGNLSLTYQQDDADLGELVFAPMELTDGSESTASESAISQSTLPEDITAQLDAFLQSQVYAEGGNPELAAPGLVLYVETPNGRYLNAAGVASLADGTPCKAKTIWKSAATPNR